MKKSVLCVMAAALVLASVAPAAAQGNLAVIDVQRVVTESDPGKDALNRLRLLQEEKIAEGQNLQQELDALRDQFTKQRFTLAEDKLEELNGQVEDRTIALQRFEDDAKRALEEARRTYLGRLEESIMPVINEVGKERGFTLIFNKFQSGLVYADEALDITDDVIRRFNTAQ